MAMLIITIEVDIAPGMEFAVKEDLAMAIEQRYGRTTRVVSVKVGDTNAKSERISKAGQAL